MTESGQHVSQNRPISAEVAQAWPIQAKKMSQIRPRPILAKIEIAQNCTNLGATCRNRFESRKIGRHPSKVGRNRGHVLSNSRTIRRIRAKFGRIRAKVNRINPSLRRCRQRHGQRHGHKTKTISNVSAEWTALPLLQTSDLGMSGGPALLRTNGVSRSPTE